jgi:hypothetical protein
VREGLAFHCALPSFDPVKSPNKRKKQRPGHNLLIRFKTFKDETLRFLIDFDVPFTNNLAEQDVRMTKIKMKISAHSEPSRALASSFACDPSSRPPANKAATSSAP